MGEVPQPFFESRGWLVSVLVSERWVLCAGVDHRCDRAGGWSGVVLGDEPSPVGGTVGVDPESHLVDGDVMVIPAEGDEVVRFVVAAPGPLVDVVGLEPVAASASFDGTLPLVPPQDIAPDDGGDGCPHIGVGDRVESVADYYPDFPVAEDL